MEALSQFMTPVCDMLFEKHIVSNYALNGLHSFDAASIVYL